MSLILDYKYDIHDSPIITESTGSSGNMDEYEQPVEFKFDYYIPLSNRDKIKRQIIEIEYIENFCSIRNWNNEDAEPINKETIKDAVIFVDQLFTMIDLDIKEPSTTPSPNGAILFTWRNNGFDTFVVSIMDNKKLVYARVRGEEYESGELKFEEEIPNRVLEIIKNNFTE
jgi:hypothetical protein